MSNFWKSLFQSFIILWSLLKEFFKRFLPVKRANINGKVVFLTGAGGGIGRQLALKFAAENTKLALLDIDKNSCEETALQVSKLGVTCKSYLCDVSKKENVAKVAKMVRKDLGEVDILVNNAGVMNFKSFLNLTEEDIKRIFNVNLLAAFWTIQEFLPEMYRRNEGHIVNISSIAGCLGFANGVDYSTSKFALKGLSESLAEDFVMNKMTGLYMSVVYPTLVDTPLTRNRSFVAKEGYSALPAESAAEVIIEGIITRKKCIFFPKNLWVVAAMSSIFPEGTMKTVRSFDTFQVKYE